ncbi:MAG: glycosyltransferase [Synechococcales cyanobacterium M58_A2018_015]|nr:glycosyltransferase [Synechococcales cyanobacterium M58_A2018_015]
MTTLPLVSVVIPAYNGDRYLSAAIDSVLQQTYPHCEIIVVNDGSTDSTAQVLASYGNRIRAFDQPNLGVAAARNRGIEVAAGELIAFLDQDDYFFPNKLALQVACLQLHPEIGMVHSGWQRVDAQGHPLNAIQPWQDAPLLTLHQWLQWMPVLLSAMMFRRCWLQRVGGLDSRFQQACDVDLVQRLALMGCAATWVRQVTVAYRQHDRNDSLNTLLQAAESWAVRDHFFARADIPLFIRQREHQYRYHTLVWIAWRLYYTHQFDAMQDYLKRSLHYTPYPPTQTILNWIASFRRHAHDQHCSFEFAQLSNLPQWQSLIQDIAAQAASYPELSSVRCYLAAI